MTVRIATVDPLVRIVAVYESIGRLMGLLGITPQAHYLGYGTDQVAARFAAGPDLMLEWNVKPHARQLTVTLGGYGGQGEHHACIELRLTENGWILRRLELEDPEVPEKERTVLSALAPGTMEEQTLPEAAALSLIEKIVREWKGKHAYPPPTKDK